jgi:hypothetical protein
MQRVMFSIPIRVAKNTIHTIETKQKGPATSCIDQGKEKIEQNGVLFTFSAFEGTNNGTNVQCGQIPTIYFRLG